MKLRYFGTSHKTAGHYFWTIEEARMICNYLNGFKSYANTVDEVVRFYPEALPIRHPHKGYSEFHQIEGYSILAIEGSPADGRPGTKMVFFVEEIISREDLVQRISANKVAMSLINACPFKVTPEII